MTAELSSLDLLYLASAAGILVLVIVLSVLAVNAIFVLKDVRKISGVLGEVVENFHGVVMKPISLASKIADTVGPHVEEFAKTQAEKLTKDKKKTKKKKS